jgi:DNA-binding CsgD family transcriptional regulator
MSLSSATRARTVEQIRQLCCLGLGREAVAPALSRLLLRLVPGLSVSFFFCDPQGELVGIYDENPALTEIGGLYMSEFHNGRDSEKYVGLAETFKLGLVGMTIRQLLKVDWQTWERTDIYNLIFRSLGYCDGIRLAVRDGARPLVGIIISRGPGEAEFTPKDLVCLTALERYFAHAFDGSSNDAPLVESDAEEDQGLAIADRDGNLLHLSPHARVLLFYATHNEIAPGRLRVTPTPELPSPVLRTIHRLFDIFEGRPVPSPPIHRHKNDWGEFVFRAFWLEGEGANSPLVGIRINRLEPLPLRLLRHLEHLPLSGRQAEVSLHLASGLTYDAIAERIGVSRNTVIFHAQQVFNKVGVSSRSELQAKLMTL